MEEIPREVSVIIPAFNEAHSIEETVEELKAKLIGLSLDYEIIVVDDGSSDSTGHVAAGMGCRVLRHGANRGYGASLRTGIEATRKSVVLFYDADGQFDPEDIEKLLTGAARAEMAAGVRGRDSHRPWGRRPGKKVLALVADFLSHTKIPDLNCGYRAIRRSAIKPYLHLLPDGFSASTTTTILFLKKGMSIEWVPVTVRRSRTRSSVRPLKDGFETVLLILRLITLFDPLRIFLPTSVLLTAVGLLWGINRYVVMHQGLSSASVFLLVSAVLVFFFGLLADQVSALRLRGLEKEGDGQRR
jgi:glycosyltransferase involved in cell wall biosynthesis